MTGFSNKRLKRIDGVYLVIMALLTAIAGEIKVIPFNGELFRFGLGSIVFFLFLLIKPPRSFILAGFMTGLTVVGFRFAGDVLFDLSNVIGDLKSHAPAFLFYFLFACGLHWINIGKYKSYPIQLGALAAGAEFIGNGTENLVRTILVTNFHLTFHDWTILAGVALLRSYFVVGLYSSIIILEHKKQMQEILSVGSELYAETLYLQKSMNHIEQVTASSYELYRKLKKQNLPELSVQALQISQEIHEVKKDSQRIYAGLSKITTKKTKEVFFLSDLLDFIISANEKYSELLRKEVTFHLTSSVDFETNQQIALLALLNNITANAVESIEVKGDVYFELIENLGHTTFIVRDTGKGIPKEDQAIVYEPGYTTKFSSQGVAATGIGLSHVQAIMQTLEGEIRLETSKSGTTFYINLPTANIKRVS